MFNNEKKVLIVSQHFWPENFRITDIVEGFLADNIEVDVLCGLPNYPKGEWFDGYDRKGPFFENYHGAKVFRCKEIPRTGNTGIRIFLNYCSWPVYARRMVRKLPGSYDAILCYNTSPVMMVWPALLAGRIFHVPVTTYVLDIWPENLYSVLKIKNKFLRTIAQNVSDWFYKQSDRLIAISPSLAKRLNERTEKPIGDIGIIPQYCEDFYSEHTENDELKREFKECFNLVFAGNFSPAQSIETIIDAVKRANQLIEMGKIHLLLVGDGMSRSLLGKKVDEEKITNQVSFYGSVKPESIPSINGFADALVVSLADSPDLGMTIPAKIASCMACGKPILASMNGEGARVIQESGGGLVSQACNSESLAENIITLFKMDEQERKEMGQKAQKYYYGHFRREVLLKEIEDFLFNNENY